MIDRVERAIRSSWSGFFFSTIVPENCPRILDSEGFTKLFDENKILTQLFDSMGRKITQIFF